MKFRELRKVLERFGIYWDSSIGKGSHGAFCGISHVTRLRKVYPLSKDQQREVSKIYLRALRKTFEVTSDHDVSDDLFN